MALIVLCGTASARTAHGLIEGKRTAAIEQAAADRVTAADSSRVWNEAVELMDVSIPTAHDPTTWFHATVLVTFLAVMWASYQLHLRRIARDFDLRLDERAHERTRIARELHDTLLKTFQGSVFSIQSARDLLPADPEKAVAALDGALDRADRAIVEGRNAIQNLRAPSIGSHELAQSIVALGRELTSGLDGVRGTALFRMCVEGSPRELHPVVRDDVHRISGEALRNAFCHAQASQIEAEVTYDAHELRVRIRDDGKGIDPEHLRAGRARHWGLTSMRERAAQIGAQLRLFSRMGAGTEVELRIPGSVAYGAGGRRSGVFRLDRTPRAGHEHSNPHPGR